MLKQYQSILPTLLQVAREHGYALGFHGSGKRDLDLIAAPWIEGAAEPAILAEALREAVGGFILNDEEAAAFPNYLHRNPEPKPHGRLAWAIHLHGPSGRLYIDLSIMPSLPGAFGPRGLGLTGLSDDEQRVMDYLVAAWNSFMQLKRAIGLDAQRDFRDAIHAAQEVLARWALARAFPDYWEGGNHDRNA